MQILHRFAGTIQGYLKQISDPDLYRPDHCPLCQAQHPLIAWGFYRRTLVDFEFDDPSAARGRNQITDMTGGRALSAFSAQLSATDVHRNFFAGCEEVTDREFIRVRRYLCAFCRRTISLLPEFALPYQRFSISVISVFLVARLLEGRSLKAAAAAACQPDMPYQRGQFWIRRFRAQAIALCVVLVARTAAIVAATFVAKALHMLQAVGWIPAHRFLFSELRTHLLGWPGFLAPAGIPVKLRPAVVQT